MKFLTLYILFSCLPFLLDAKEKNHQKLLEPICTINQVDPITCVEIGATLLKAFQSYSNSKEKSPNLENISNALNNLNSKIDILYEEFKNFGSITQQVITKSDNKNLNNNILATLEICQDMIVFNKGVGNRLKEELQHYAYVAMIDDITHFQILGCVMVTQNKLNLKLKNSKKK